MWQHVGWTSNSFSSKPDEKTLYDYFPELFKDELKDIEDKKRKKEEEVYKAQMMDYAERLRLRNKSKEKYNGNNT